MTDYALQLERRALKRRLYGLAKRADDFDIPGVELMHQALDNFRAARAAELENKENTNDA